MRSARGWRDVPPALYARWGAAAAAALVVAVTLAAVLTVAMPLSAGEVKGYLFATLGALLFVFAGLWRLLPENRRADAEPPLPRLGSANTVTVARATTTALLVGQLVVPWPTGGLAWLPAGLYLAVALGDAVDGWLARRTGSVTVLGSRLDLEVDAAALLVATLLVVRRGALPLWLLLAGVARYAYVLALAWRRRRGGVVEALPPGPRRRLRAGQQMGLVAVALWPPVPVAGSRLAAYVITLPFLAGFVRDFLVVSGRLDPSSRSYLRLRKALLLTVESVLPVVARVVLLLGLPALLATAGVAPALSDRWQATFSDWGWAALEAWAMLPSVAVSLVALAAVAIVMGVLPRVAALVVLAGLFLELQSAPLDPLRALLLAATLWILVFGPGPWPLWAPDEAMLGPGHGRSSG